MSYNVIVENGLVQKNFNTKADAIIYLMELKARGINDCRIEAKEVANESKLRFRFRKKD